MTPEQKLKRLIWKKVRVYLSMLLLPGMLILAGWAFLGRRPQTNPNHPCNIVAIRRGCAEGRPLRGSGTSKGLYCWCQGKNPDSDRDDGVFFLYHPGRGPFN